MESITYHVFPKTLDQSKRTRKIRIPNIYDKNKFKNKIKNKVRRIKPISATTLNVNGFLTI